MIKFFALVSVLTLAQNAITQIVVADNDTAETKHLFVDDNPIGLPKWELNIQPVTLGINPKLLFGIHIAPKYRYKNIFSVTVPLTYAYWKTNYHGSEDEKNSIRTLDFKFIGTFKVVSKEVQKTEPIKIGDQQVWEDFKRKKLRTLNANAGIGYLESGSKYKYYGTTALGSRRLFGGRIESMRVIGGISLDFSKSSKIKTENYTVANYRINRFYSNIAYSFYKRYDIVNSNFEVISDNLFLNLVYFMPIGWSIGYEYYANIFNSANAFTVGFEFGQMPRYIQKGVGAGHTSRYKIISFQGNFPASSKFYSRLSVGFAIGSKGKK